MCAGCRGPEVGSPVRLIPPGYRRDSEHLVVVFERAHSPSPAIEIARGDVDGAIGYLRTFEKPFWDDATEWIDRSAIFYVENVTTPTMLMTGENDLRTPMGQTEEFYQALQYVGVPTAMIRFQEEWHGTTSRPSDFLRTQLYLRKWFEKWGSHEPLATTDDAGGPNRNLFR